MLQEFIQQLDKMSGEKLDGVHTAIPGKIVSFDIDTCEATVMPSGKMRMPDGTYMDYPQISSVPVVLMQGAAQSATIAYPIKSGDGCLLIISEVALDTWRSDGQSAMTLKHDLTNAIAIPGLMKSPNAVVKEATNTNSVIIDSNGKRITVSAEGVTVNGDITVTGDVTVSGRLRTGGIVMNSHTHSGVQPGLGSTSGPQ